MIIFKVFFIENHTYLKHPGVGGEVVPHQDSTFLFTEPNSTIGFWFALDDCTPENGTLSFIPGSHKSNLSILYMSICRISNRQEDGSEY
jgi:ectoine hydroxylase-related dioxygenase (phytanoyl-CoA dioxygenase family)